MITAAATGSDSILAFTAERMAVMKVAEAATIPSLDSSRLMSAQ